MIEVRSVVVLFYIVPKGRLNARFNQRSGTHSIENTEESSWFRIVKSRVGVRAVQGLLEFKDTHRP